MSGFPQLLDEDFDRLQQVLVDLLERSGAKLILLVEKAGYLIHSAGVETGLDPTQLAALASNCFNATQFMGSLIAEPEFNCTYQKGADTSLLILNVDQNCLLVVLFDSSVSVGAVRFCAAPAIESISNQLRIARDRNPTGTISIVDLNPAEIGDVFQKRAGNSQAPLNSK